MHCSMPILIGEAGSRVGVYVMRPAVVRAPDGAGVRSRPGRSGGTGRRTGLKIRRLQGRGGSIPPFGIVSRDGPSCCGSRHTMAARSGACRPAGRVVLCSPWNPLDYRAHNWRDGLAHGRGPVFVQRMEGKDLALKTKGMFLVGLLIAVVALVAAGCGGSDDGAHRGDGAAVVVVHGDRVRGRRRSR